MKTLLLTGGTGKFGRAIIHYFRNSKIKIAFTSRSIDEIEKLEQQYIKNTLNLTGIKIDLKQIDSASFLYEFLEEKKLNIHSIINCARSLSSLGVKEDGTTTRDNFVNEYLIDVVIPYELSMTFANKSDHLKNIINIGSQYGMVAPNPSLYNNFEQESPIQYGVAKAALVHLTKELAVRLSNKKIKVNCVAYGGVEGRVDENFKTRYARLLPMKRMLNEKEIAPPIAFLLEKNVAMTGQTIVVDGGWSVW